MIGSQRGVQPRVSDNCQGHEEAWWWQAWKRCYRGARLEREANTVAGAMQGSISWFRGLSQCERSRQEEPGLPPKFPNPQGSAT